MADMNKNDEPKTFFGRLLGGVVLSGVTYVWLLSFEGQEGRENNINIIVALALGMLFFFVGKNLWRWLVNFF